MKLKYVLFLVGIFIFLTGLLCIKKVYIKQKARVNEYQQTDIHITPSEIAAFEVNIPYQARTVKVKQDLLGVWRLPQVWDTRCRDELSGGFLQKLAGLKGELRSDSEEFLADYGIEDQEAVSIKFFNKNGEEIEDLLLGVKSKPLSNSFFRKKGSSKVYVANKNIFSLLNLHTDPRYAIIDLRAWMDPNVFSFDDRRITAIKVSKGVDGREEVVVDIEKKAGDAGRRRSWVNMGEKFFLPVDAKKVTGYLKKIASQIIAIDAVDPKGKDYGFDKPFLKMVLSRNNGIDSILMVGSVSDHETKDRYMKADDGFIYIVAPSVVDLLDVDLADFLEDAPLGVDSAQVEAIKIRSLNKKVELEDELLMANKTFVQQLSYVPIEDVVMDKRYAKGLKIPAKYSVAITQKDHSLVELDVEKGQDGFFIAQIRGKTGVFTVPRDWFEMVFEKFNELDLKKNKEN